jgi:fatty acid synthase subunit alpha, fungi type
MTSSSFAQSSSPSHGFPKSKKNPFKALYEGVVRSLRKDLEPTRARAATRSRRSSSQFLRPQIFGVTSVSANKVPLLHLKRKVGASGEYSSNLTGAYLNILHEIATSGTTFKDKNALLTGVGKGSIGVEILKGLLSGGAHVVITTSRYNRSTVEYYQSIYQSVGSCGSALTVVLFNQGSKQDVEALVDYICATLGMDLDYILPFAAIPENGREIDSLDDKSELAHRIMLVNLLRILGLSRPRRPVATLSHVRHKSFFLSLQIMVSSATTVSIRSRKYLWKLCSIAGVPRAGANTCA